MNSRETDPDFLIRDLLATMKANRDTILSELAERHRVDGVSDFGMMRLLVIYDAAIGATERAAGDG